MTPVEVEWDEPDDDRRRAAAEAVDRDRAAVAAHREGKALGGDVRNLVASLVRADLVGESVDDVWAARHPDLRAVVVRRGLLLGVERRIDGWEISGSAQRGFHRVTPVDARWVALVMTDVGCVELDPSTLRPAST